MGTDIFSPYGANKHRVIAGTDIPAVEGLRGQGDESAYGQGRNSDGVREINASTKRDMMSQIGAMMRHAQTDQRLVMAAADSQAAAERWLDFKAAFADKDTKPFQVIGEVMSDEVWLTLGREGFSNRILAIQNVNKGDTGRVRVRRKDVVSFQITTDVKVQEQRIRQPYV